MRRNQHANFTVDFTVSQRTQQLTTAVTRRGPFGAATAHPLPAHTANVCANLISGSCPFTFIRKASQRLPVPLSPSLFNYPLALTFRIANRGPNNQTISCFEVDLRTGFL